MNGRSGQAQESCDLNRAEAFAGAETDDLLLERSRGLVRVGVGARRAIRHAGRSEIGIAVGPFLGGGPGHVEVVRGVGDRPRVIDDELRDSESLGWGECCVSVGNENLGWWQ